LIGYRQTGFAKRNQPAMIEGIDLAFDLTDAEGDEALVVQRSSQDDPGYQAPGRFFIERDVPVCTPGMNVCCKTFTAIHDFI